MRWALYTNILQHFWTAGHFIRFENPVGAHLKVNCFNPIMKRKLELLQLNCIQVQLLEISKRGHLSISDALGGQITVIIEEMSSNRGRSYGNPCNSEVAYNSGFSGFSFVLYFKAIAKQQYQGTSSISPECPDYQASYCRSRPCRNGGICKSNTDKFTCDCTLTGFTGETCENGKYWWLRYAYVVQLSLRGTWSNSSHILLLQYMATF